MLYIYIFLKTFTFLEDEGFSILVFSFGDKGGDRSFTSGGSSWYSAGIEKDIQVITLRSTVPWVKKAMMGGADMKLKKLIFTSLV